MSATELFAHDDILPDDPVDEDGEPLEVLHDREYRVRAFRLAADRILIRGGVRDQKPPFLYIDVDPDPLTIHHMQVDIEVALPSLEIVAAKVHMETHPNVECTRIEPHYEKLVGLSIARGFTHRVRELFGGPRACTHTTALLQAMAPVAIQSMWSMRASTAKSAAGAAGAAGAEGAEVAGSTEPARPEVWRMNVNTCHVWAEDSAVVAHLSAGGAFGVPEFAKERMVELGIKPEEWARRMGS